MTVKHTLVHTLGPGLDDNNRLALASEQSSLLRPCS